jgi:hypothetical protein
MRDLAEAVILADDLNKKSPDSNRLIPPLRREREEVVEEEPLM